MRFLVDEMFPPGAARLLVGLGRDAVHVLDASLAARPDAERAAFARRELRVIVTENLADFAREHYLVILGVLKSRLPRQGMAARLAELLDGWAGANPEPYVGLHWPKIDG